MYSMSLVDVLGKGEDFMCSSNFRSSVLCFVSGCTKDVWISSDKGSIDKYLRLIGFGLSNRNNSQSICFKVPSMNIELKISNVAVLYDRSGLSS